MASLRDVRDRIVSVKSTQQITKAMKMVAAAKLRKSQDAIIQLRPYASKMAEILGRVSGETSENASPFAVKKEISNVLVVVITSDRGLCGSFNMNVCKSATQVIHSKYQSQYENGNVKLLCIGKKGLEFFNRRSYKTDDRFVSTFLHLSFDNVKTIAETVMADYLENKYDVVEIVYNEFKNVATQVVCAEQFLPIVQSENKEESTVSEIDYIFEPSKTQILEDLIPKSLKLQFFKTLLESNASENGARMTAMDKATDNAGELIKELNLIYNRTRQAAITTEILEIVGGAEALAKGQ